MASNYTMNYQLNQWEAADQVLRTDFNQDNQKIDAALAGLAAKNTELGGAVAAPVAGGGNCQMELFTYTGTGAYGATGPTQVQFTQKPDVYLISGDLALLAGYSGSGQAFMVCRVFNSNSDSFTDSVSTTWDGAKLSLLNYSRARYQMNTQNQIYWVLGLHKKS